MNNILKKIPLEVGSATDTGKVREENQDSIGFFITKDGVWTMLTVCDGMGGHASGKKASTIAVNILSRVFGETITMMDVRQALGEAIEKANSAIFEGGSADPESKGMGSTCAVLAVSGDQAWIAHVGDSRVYRIRPGKVERLTIDHSSVQRMLDSGMITEEQSREHPDSNVLYRCLGVKPEVQPDIRGPEKIEKDDCYLLCSDGLSGLVEDEVLAAIASMNSAQDAVEKLIALAKDRGGHDNVSVQVLRRADGYSPMKEFRPELFKKVPRKIIAAIAGPVGSSPTSAKGMTDESETGAFGWHSRKARAGLKLLSVLLVGMLVGFVIGRLLPSGPAPDNERFGNPESPAKELPPEPGPSHGYPPAIGVPDAPTQSGDGKGIDDVKVGRTGEVASPKTAAGKVKHRPRAPQPETKTEGVTAPDPVKKVPKEAVGDKASTPLKDGK